MEAKKSPAADLTRLSNCFFAIGLIVALSIVIMAFEWKEEVVAFEVFEHDAAPFDLSDKVPVTDILPPPVPAKAITVIEVEDKEEIEDSLPLMDIESEEYSETSEMPVSVEEAEASEDIPVVIVEEPATPRNGMNGFYQYVREKIKYPYQAARAGIEGRVFVEFVVNKDGSLTDIKVVKGIGGGCDEEAMKIISAAPPWNPGKQRGRPVRQRMTLPITFRID